MGQERMGKGAVNTPPHCRNSSEMMLWQGKELSMTIVIEQYASNQSKKQLFHKGLHRTLLAAIWAEELH